MKKLIVFPALLKAHVDSYTRKDGTFVKEHDTSVQAAKPMPEHVQKMVASISESSAAPEHKKAAIDAIVAQHAGAGGASPKLVLPTKKPAATGPFAPKLQEGDTVKVTGNVQGAGKTGFIHSTAPSGSFHIVEHSDGSRSSYHESDLSPHEPDDDDDDDKDHMAKSKPVMLVRADMLKAQVKAYTRSDGTFVKEHTTSVQAAAPKPGDVGHHEHATYGAYFKKGEKVKDRQGNQHEVLSHVGPEVKTVSGQSFHSTKLSRVGGDGGKPAAVAPNVAKAKKAVKSALYDKDTSALGPHKVGDSVSYKAERGTKSGVVKGARDGKVVVEHKGGYTEMKHHSELSGAASKPTGSAAPAKKVNVGSEKWPMHVKSSEKLPAKHHDGSTHHVGGFKPPEFPAGGGATDGDTMVHHEGKTFHFTGKKGKDMKTGEDAYEYSHTGDRSESRAWVSKSGHLKND